METVKSQNPNLSLVLILCAANLWQACDQQAHQQINRQNDQSLSTAETSSPLVAPTSPVMDYANALSAAINK